MFSYEFKPRLWPTLATIPMLICLLQLGFWQVERLDWKLSLLDKIDARAKGTPVSLPQDANDMDELEYLRVQVSGSFDNDHEVTMYSVGPNGEPGYDLYTPMILANDQQVIVNRGWVPETLKEVNTRPQTQISGDVTITALLRKPWGKLWYGPENEPENNMWFYGDLEGMSDTMNLANTFPMFLSAEKKNTDNRFPIAGRTEFNIVNNHLDYALTWFGLAIVLVGIYLIAHINKKSV
ncbi:MAG: SURF1 family protein [Kordiimonadaceae bacterium]|jgi:surfeit locus 1 family protein|nr:SURF1 family protein [Kordiimonadaceae bacterium]MBT6031213.1 SURF1 family protein [Kordiimonadaceae bacterium]